MPLPPLGAPVSDLIRALPTIVPDVATFDFCVYQSRQSMLDVTDRLASPSAASWTHGKHGWERIDQKPFRQDQLDEVIGLALRHSTEHSARPMPAYEVADAAFLNLVPVRGDQVAAITTRCKLRDHSEANLSMLDFRCPPEDYFVYALKIALRKIAPGGGAIVHSGRSLHFYGFELLSESGWRTFMYRSLLLSPMTDARYVAHRLLDGFADLRITTSSVKPMVPTILAYL